MERTTTAQKIEQRIFNWNDKSEVWYVCPCCKRNVPWMFNEGKVISILNKCGNCGQPLETGWENPAEA